MEGRVEIYLKSFPIARDIEEYRHASAHTYCAPGMTQGVHGLRGFKGRMLTPECAEFLTDITIAQHYSGVEVHVHDVGRLSGMLRALARRIWKTPAVVLDGESHIGLENARIALSGVSGRG